jgi:hypothetical protein
MFNQEMKIFSTAVGSDTNISKIVQPLEICDVMLTSSAEMTGDRFMKYLFVVINSSPMCLPVSAWC